MRSITQIWGMSKFKVPQMRRLFARLEFAPPSASVMR
jgi:hypothetical protein